MKIQLISKPCKDFKPIIQVLLNRGVPVMDIGHYLHTTDADINSPLAFGEERMRAGATMLIKHVKANSITKIIVDCDCDGFTSAALIYNYLHDLFPAWVEQYVSFLFHDGKQHGFSDHMEELKDCDFIICPDAGSNDEVYHEQLKADILILDHHECENYSKYAVTINNQMCDYSNKQLSGVGVTWQFCRYIDSLTDNNYADNYLDLVALGNCGDMMSLLSMETKHLINKGFLPENVKNPFIYGMWQKNAFKLGDHITSIGAAFYIVPFVNAICRSGTQEEKELIFKSMIPHFAFQEQDSTKRGHAPGEKERLVDAALRTCTNVKNRQTKLQDAGMEFLENEIAKNNLLDHKMLLILLDGDVVSPTIRGLCANKLMAKYQRPVAVLSKTANGWEGSARGYTKTGLDDFKAVCEKHNAMYAVGHANAFGLGIKEDWSEPEIAGDGYLCFLSAIDEALKDISTEICYRVDYFYDASDKSLSDTILDLAEYDSLYGQDLDEPLIAVHDVKVTPNMVTVMKGNTLKITLPSGVPMIKFSATDEEIEALTRNPNGSVTIDVVGRGNKNVWNGNVSAQLMITDYEIKKTLTWEF